MPRYLVVLIGIVAAFFVTCLGSVVVFFATHKYVDSYQIGYRFDARTGIVDVLPRTGWFKKAMFVESINTVDTRPMQVCINANSRVLNCKLVQFNPAGLSTFIAWHGRADYEASTPSDPATGSFNDIMKSYAYDGSGRNYPFLTILRELRSDEVGQPLSMPTPVVQAPAPTPVTK